MRPPIARVEHAPSAPARRRRPARRRPAMKNQLDDASTALVRNVPMSAQGTSSRPTLCDRYCSQTGLTTGTQQAWLLREDLVVAGERPRLAPRLARPRPGTLGRTPGARSSNTMRQPASTARIGASTSSSSVSAGSGCQRSGAARRSRRSRRASTTRRSRCGAATSRTSSRGRRRRRSSMPNRSAPRSRGSAHR